MKKLFLSACFSLVVVFGVFAQDCVTGFCPPSIRVHHIAGSISPITVTIDYYVHTVSTFATVNKCVIIQNLGATHPPANVTDASVGSAGWYWQFNRRQGYYYDTYRIPSTYWQTPISENAEWYNTGNDPCTLLLGGGWRIPNQWEWENTFTDPGRSRTIAFSYNATRLHAAGCLDHNSAQVVYRGDRGYYWSDHQISSIDAYYVYFDISNLGVTSYAKSSGYSVRCLKDL